MTLADDERDQEQPAEGVSPVLPVSKVNGLLALGSPFRPCGVARTVAYVIDAGGGKFGFSDAKLMQGSLSWRPHCT
jgi:hypothetical protein